MIGRSISSSVISSQCWSYLWFSHGVFNYVVVFSFLLQIVTIWGKGVCMPLFQFSTFFILSFGMTVIPSEGFYGSSTSFVLNFRIYQVFFKFSICKRQQKTNAGSCGSEVCLFWCVAHLELPYYTCSLHFTIRKWFNESTRSCVI